jgi:hypothetical protein
MPFLKDVAMQSRLLIALPMLILIKPFIDNRVMIVSQYLASALMPAEQRQEILSNTYARAEKLTSSALTEIILLLLIIGTTASMVSSGVYSALTTGTSWMASTSGGVQTLSHAGYWAVFFSLPLFQFFLLRWLWRYIVWVSMLFRLSKAEMYLPPTHADRACGLGVIALAQNSFNMIFVTGSVILSGQLIALLLQNPDSFNIIRGEAIGYIVVSLILIILPLLFFTGKILKIKNKGLVNLSDLGVNLSRKFENEWVNNLPVEKKPTADPVNPSMIYDYAGMYEYLQQLRPVPITIRDAVSMVIMLFLPFIPILFVHFSVAELLQRIGKMFV